jgi:hypothetical protein
MTGVRVGRSDMPAASLPTAPALGQHSRGRPGLTLGWRQHPVRRRKLNPKGLRCPALAPSDLAD